MPSARFPDDATRRLARRAGVLYLLAGLPAPFALLYVPSTIIVAGDAAATADRLRHLPMLVRLGVAGELTNAVLVTFAVLALWRLFERVGPGWARAMVALIVVSIPVSLLNLVNALAALMLARGSHALGAFAPAQLDAMAYLFMRLHDQGLIVAQVFWGLWLLPYGVLAIRSGFVPRVVAVVLMVAGLAYVVNSGVALLLPALAHAVSPVVTALEAGEIPMLVWLLWAPVRTTGGAPRHASESVVAVRA